MSNNSIVELVSELHRNRIPENEYRFYIEKHLENKARLLGIPRKGHFELTPLCNFDCKMCYVHLNNQQFNGRKLLSGNQWIEIMDQAIQAGIQYATLSGGECLLHPDFDEIYTFLINRGTRVYVLTNGFYLNQKKDLFSTYPPENIQVTLYGSNDDEYQTVTGHRGFETVYSNIENFRKIGIHLQVTITPNICLKIENFIHLMDVLYAKRIPFRLNPEIVTPRNETGRSQSVIDLDVTDYIKLFRHYKELGEIESTSVSNYHEHDFIPNTHSSVSASDTEYSQRNNRGLICGAGRSGFTVTWDGMMIPCLDLYEVQMDLASHSFSECWHTINSYCNNYPRIEKCSHCEYSKICMYCFPKHKSAQGQCNIVLCERTKAFVAANILSQ